MVKIKAESMISWLLEGMIKSDVRGERLKGYILSVGCEKQYVMRKPVHIY